MQDIEYYKLCKCGCGKKIKENRVFISGHNARVNNFRLLQREERICLCGCNEKFICKINSKKKFIWGHNSKYIVPAKAFKKNMITWNKGLTKEKDNRLINNSIHKIDCKCYRCRITRREINGVNNYMFGRKGKHSTNWNNGSSFYPYSVNFTKELKKQIRERDEFKCQNCGMLEQKHKSIYKEVLSIHHIDYNKERCDKYNLISLCKSCHLRTNFNRKYWIDFFIKKVGDINGKKQ